MIYREIVQEFEKSQSPLQIVEGELFYPDSNSIPEHCIVLAKEYKTRIIDYLSGKDMTQQSKRDELFIKVMYYYRDICDQSNDQIEQWLNQDHDAATLFTKLTTAYEGEGWSNISEAPFNLSTVESERLLEALYQNAIAFFKKGRSS